VRKHALGRPLDRLVRVERDLNTEPDPSGRDAASRRGCFSLLTRTSVRSLKQGEVVCTARARPSKETRAV